jgi:hypothetical protein
MGLSQVRVSDCLCCGLREWRGAVVFQQPVMASLAVGDYQNRVQLTARAVSKTATSLDQLTRLQ